MSYSPHQTQASEWPPILFCIESSLTFGEYILLELELDEKTETIHSP